jgi:hypothetical protein
MTAVRTTSQASEDSDGLVIVDTYRVAPADSTTAALYDPGVPRAGDRHPDTPSNLAVTRRAQYVQGSRHAFDVVIEYRPLIIIPPQEDPGGNQLDDVTVRSENSIVNAWRIAGKDEPLKFPDDVSAPGQEASDDIGGVLVDNRGTPIDLPLKVLGLHVPVRFAQYAPTGVFYDHWQTRNARQFDIFQPNTVLFTGWSLDIEQSGDGNIVGFMDFAVDPWFHLRQKPFRDVNGDVKLVIDGGPPPLLAPATAGRARTVVWDQPFPETSDLTRLLRLTTG